jgi:hypothetical protein
LSYWAWCITGFIVVYQCLSHVFLDLPWVTPIGDNPKNPSLERSETWKFMEIRQRPSTSIYVHLQHPGKLSVFGDPFDLTGDSLRGSFWSWSNRLAAKRQ